MQNNAETSKSKPKQKLYILGTDSLTKYIYFIKEYVPNPKPAGHKPYCKLFCIIINTNCVAVRRIVSIISINIANSLANGF